MAVCTAAVCTGYGGYGDGGWGHLARGGAAMLRLGDSIAARPRSTAVQKSIDELPSTRAAAGAGAPVYVGSKLRCSVPPRSRACADRPPIMFLGACGSAVSAACMSAL
eukprot:397617-Prymnesium_polylepis.1